jgi:hypothetical protein
LVVVRRAENRPVPYVRKNGRAYAPEVQWICICDCGNERVVTANKLRGGEIKSCGCSKYDPRPTYRLKAFRPGQAGRNAVLKQYRASARDRGLFWGLSDEEFDRLTSEDCHYCGCAPSAIHRGAGRSSGEFVYNGLDRVNNSVGYIPCNAVPCCSVCNHAKKDMPYEDFIAWIVRLARFQEKLEALWTDIDAKKREIRNLERRIKRRHDAAELGRPA